MKTDPSKYGVSDEKLRVLEVRLQNLDEKLLTGSILEVAEHPISWKSVL
jgi:hypothetical protein